MSMTTPIARGWWSEAMLLMVAAVWGASYGMTKTALTFYPVVGFLALRFCIASLLLLPAWRGLSKRQVVTTLAAGIPLGLIVLSNYVSETYGVSLTQASRAAFLISMFVVFTPFVEWIVLGSRPCVASFVAAGVSLAGTWLLTSTMSLSFNVGDGLILIAAILRATQAVCTARLTRGADIPPLPLMAAQTGTVGFGCLALGAIELPGGMPALPDSATFWIATGFLVVTCTLFAFFAQNHALKRTSPTRVSLLMSPEPLFGALFAVGWLHESLSPGEWIGGLMIVAASLWAASCRAERRVAPRCAPRQGGLGTETG
jgi:drug/metabolite transporter (DMT)-like permease